MTGPTIRVAADVSAVKRAIDEVVTKTKEATAAAGGKVKLDTSEAEKKLDGLHQAVDGLQGALSSVGDALDLEGAQEAIDALTGAADVAERLEGALSGTAPAKAIASTAANVRKLAAELERARRVQEVLAREGIKLSREQAQAATKRFETWRDSSTRGTRKLQGKELDEFLDGGWRNTSLNELEARRARRDVLRAVGVPAGGDGDPGGRGLGTYVLDTAGRGVRGVAGAALPVGGPGGAIMRGAVAEAAATEGGLLSGAGMARLATGGLIGASVFGAVKAVQGVAAKVGDAEGEAGAYGDLSRQVGAVAGDFDALRSAVRATTHGLGLTYNEAAQLAQVYAREAAMGPRQRESLAGELQGAAAFSRGFGIDPAAGVGFFATLRRMGASDGEAGNRRFALLIADAIAQKGDFARTGALVDAVERFAAASTAQSMAPANVTGFMDLVGRFSGLNAPGMGSTESAGLVSRLDQGFRAGGGTAGQNFLLSVLQRASRDVNVLDLSTVTGGGFFATGESLFGKGSTAYKAAQAAKDPHEMARLERMARDFGAEPVGLREARELVDFYRSHGGTQAASSALQGRYGLSAQEAQSTISALMGQHGSLDGLSDKLKAAKVDPSAVPIQNLGLLASLANGDRGTLEKQARELLDGKGANALGEKQRVKLDEALQGKDTEALRSQVLVLAANRVMPNKGEETRESIKSLQNVLQDFAGKLVPLTTSIRDAVVGFAVSKGLMSREQAWAGRGAEARAMLEGQLAAAGNDKERRAAILASEMDRISKDDKLPDAYKVEVGRMLADEPGRVVHHAAGGKGDHAAFLAKLAAMENGGRTGGTNVLGYAGKYQMGEAALIDAGYYEPDGTKANDWRGRWTGKGRIRSLQQFLASEAGQDEAVTAFHEKNWTAIQQRGLDKFLGRNVGGIDITKSGLLAGAHLLGVGGVETFLRSGGTKVPRDGNGMPVSVYLDKLGGMDVDAGARRRAAPVDPDALPAAAAAKQAPRDQQLPDVGVRGLGLDAGMPAPLPMLSQQRSTAAEAQRFAFEHRVVLVDQHGRERAAPLVTTSTSGPVPAGATR
jgi:hypothetical protein